MQLMIFDDEILNQYGDARVLREEDYPLYKKFFIKAYPDANPEGWLYEYFKKKVLKEYLFGYVINNNLVCVCNAPDMPYMNDIIQHTGISTLLEKRRMGYAKSTAALAAHHLTKIGICPKWECDANNISSINLSKFIGYKEYGVTYILEEYQ